MKLRFAGLTAFILIAGLLAACHTAPRFSPQGYAPPGKLVDIGGRKLHLYCTGKGSPVVVLMAGGGAYAIDWALVQPRIAATTRVCSYDRAALGWSDAGPAEETVQETVGDLHSLLHAAGETEPYVLVGWRFNRWNFYSGVSAGYSARDCWSRFRE